jgi:hypothetical protein
MGYSYTVQDLKFDFSDERWMSHWDFMLSEFFKATKETKDEFRKAYFRKYGAGPYDHMMRNFWYSWERGNRSVSDTQSYRIYCLMPPLLNEAALHRLGFNEFMMSIKKTVKEFLDNQKKLYSKTVTLKSPQEVIHIFEKEFEKIKNITLFDLKSRVISPEEKQEALEIAQYILETKLQNSFDQIERDFNVFLPYMFSFNRGIFSASYSITTFNVKVDITRTGLDDVALPKFKIREIEANSNFKNYADKYLAYELVNIHSQSQTAVANSFLNSHDIKIFFDHYEEISLGDSEVNMKSTFQGEGGTLSIEAQMKPLKMIKTSFAVSITKLIIYSIIFIGLVTTAINYKLFTLLIIGGLFVGSLFYTLFIEEIKQLKILRIQIKQYGQ